VSKFEIGCEHSSSTNYDLLLTLTLYIISIRRKIPFIFDFEKEKGVKLQVGA
jgi:hypothetical protein